MPRILEDGEEYLNLDARATCPCAFFSVARSIDVSKCNVLGRRQL